MKIIKLIALLALFSIQAEATGYSHNMFVAHKKLQAGKECKTSNEHVILKKAGSSRVQVKASSASQQQADDSFTRQVANRLSGMVTLNQRVLEEDPSIFFDTEEEQKSVDTIVDKLVVTVKGLVYAFIGSSAFGR